MNSHDEKKIVGFFNIFGENGENIKFTLIYNGSNKPYQVKEFQDSDHFPSEINTSATVEPIKMEHLSDPLEKLANQIDDALKALSNINIYSPGPEKNPG